MIEGQAKQKIYSRLGFVFLLAPLVAWAGLFWTMVLAIAQSNAAPQNIFLDSVITSALTIFLLGVFGSIVFLPVAVICFWQAKISKIDLLIVISGLAIQLVIIGHVVGVW